MCPPTAAIVEAVFKWYCIYCVLLLIAKKLTLFSVVIVYSGVESHLHSSIDDTTVGVFVEGCSSKTQIRGDRGVINTSFISVESLIRRFGPCTCKLSPIGDNNGCLQRRRAHAYTQPPNNETPSGSKKVCVEHFCPGFLGCRFGLNLKAFSVENAKKA